MSTRLTLLMQMTTSPTQRTDASPHTGGWSESWWKLNDMEADDTRIRTLIMRRASLLPAEASVVGYRLAYYDYSGPFMIPRGSTTARVQYPGNSSRSCGQPQDALMFSGAALGMANSTRFACRAIPDGQIRNGEYQPDSSYRSAVTSFCNELVNNAWGFIGRDLTKENIALLSIIEGRVKTQAPIGAVVGTDYMRFNRVYDDDGRQVVGSYLTLSLNDLGYALAGFTPRPVSGPSGTVRCDRVTFCALGIVEPNRSVVRKIGRPFESYRGRR